MSLLRKELALEIRQLRHFALLAEEMHFGRAAKRLHMTQPALSASLMRLEESLGVRLFERDNKHVQLTFAGEALLRRALDILSHVDRTKAYAQSLSLGRAGRIELGFTVTLVYRGLREMLRHFNAHFPEVELSLREMPSQRQVEKVRARQLDAGFINTPMPPDGLQHLLIREERFVACLPESHPLVSRTTIRLEALRDEPFVMFAHEGSPTNYDHVLRLCVEAGFQPKIALEAGQLLSVVALVASGIGVSVVPESVARAGVAGARFLPIEGSVAHPCAYLVWNEGDETPGLSALISTVRTVRVVSFSKPTIQLVNRAT